MKRIFDIAFSLVLIVLLSPIMLAISLIIFIMSGAPVIFRQPRLGKDEKIFVICKFRTMRRNTPKIHSSSSILDGFITREGRYLRLLSLDELPQLFNVLSGTMSLVGPRPLIPGEKKIRMLRRAANVYSVRPGITGLAQINGRDSLKDWEKAALDKRYIETRSLMTDVKILLKTILVVIPTYRRRRGADK